MDEKRKSFTSQACNSKASWDYSTKFVWDHDQKLVEMAWIFTFFILLKMAKLLFLMVYGVYKSIKNVSQK